MKSDDSPGWGFPQEKPERVQSVMNRRFQYAKLYTTAAFPWILDSVDSGDQKVVKSSTKSKN
jgi:hypothetical protein